MGCGNETQLQVGEKLNYLILRFRVIIWDMNSCTSLVFFKPLVLAALHNFLFNVKILFHFFVCHIRLATQQTQNICIAFVQCWTDVNDVGPTLYECYTNLVCLLGTYHVPTFKNCIIMI